MKLLLWMDWLFLVAFWIMAMVASAYYLQATDEHAGYRAIITIGMALVACDLFTAVKILPWKHKAYHG